jgi:polyhydroxybutyrate depolymerase
VLIPLLIACSNCPPGGHCVEGGGYLVDVPEGEGPYKALLWFHGYNEDAEHLRGKPADLQALLDGGWLVLAPQGDNERWKIHDLREGGSDLDYAEAVLVDAEERYGLGTVVASGHSVGASVAYELGCQRDSVDAVAGFHGLFWEPVPSGCEASPKPIRHVHGTTDEIWPMEGRAFLGMAQGDVLEGVEAWRIVNGCTEEATSGLEGPSTCTTWTCSEAPVTYCEHDGPHKLQSGFGQRYVDWAEGLGLSRSRRRPSR